MRTTTTPSKETARVRLYVGTQQVGKSTLALSHAYESERVPLLVDPRGTMVPRPLVDGKLRRWELPRATSIADVGRLVYRERVGCVYTPARREADFDLLCKAALNERTGKILFLIDEWSLLCSQRWAPESLEDAMRTCAHVNVEFLITTQCPQDIKSTLRNCVNEVYTFQCPDENAQKVLRQWFPDAHTFGQLPAFSVRKWPISSPPRH